MSPVQLMFQDWGVPAQLQELVPTYDPATGELTFATSEVSLTVIPGPIDQQRRQDTAAILPGQQQSYLVPRDQLPPNISLVNTRLALDGTTYQLQQLTDSPISGLAVLTCNAVPPDASN